MGPWAALCYKTRKSSGAPRGNLITAESHERGQLAILVFTSAVSFDGLSVPQPRELGKWVSAGREAFQGYEVSVPSLRRQITAEKWRQRGI